MNNPAKQRSATAPLGPRYVGAILNTPVQGNQSMKFGQLRMLAIRLRKKTGQVAGPEERRLSEIY